MSRVARGLALALTLLMLVQPVLPAVLAQGGHDHAGHDHGGSGGGDASDRSSSGGSNNQNDARLKPEARAITPGARYVEQRNAEAHHGLVVWEERGIGRDWDIMAYNFTAGGEAYPLTTRAVNEHNPQVRGPWVAWEDRHTGQNASTDLTVFDMRTGNSFRVPDSGFDEVEPEFGADATLYYLEKTDRDKGQIRAFDLETREVSSPLGNRTVLFGPSVHKDKLVWAEGRKADADIRMLNLSSGQKTDIPRLWNLDEGPVVGPHGVAFITTVGGRQRGTYTTLYNTTTEDITWMRSGVYPHANLDQCENGVLWDQPGSASTDTPNVAIWDAFLRKRITFSSQNTDPTCTGDHLVFTKRVPGEDDDLGSVPRIYHLNLAEARLPADAKIKMAPGMARGIYSEPTTFQGIAIPGDAREPIQEVYGRVDGETFRPLRFNRTDQGVEWSMRVNAPRFLSGQHIIDVRVVDDRGVSSTQGFIFYTDTPYRLDANSLEDGVDVPRSEPSPFPFNILDHYQAYQQFYNTVVLVLLIVGGAIYGYYRHKANQPPPTPEFVPPDGS